MGLFSNIVGRIKGALSAPGVPSMPDLPPDHPSRRHEMAAKQGQQPASQSMPEGEEALQFKDWVSVTSSWISALRYNYVQTAAYMRTKSGREYQFGGMSFALFKKWFMASSKGEFFNANLKGRFTQSEVEPAHGRGIMAGQLRAQGHVAYGQASEVGKAIAAQARAKAEASRYGTMNPMAGG